MRRRLFLATSVTLLLLVPGLWRLLGWGFTRERYAAELVAIARCLLPSRIGESGLVATVDGFFDWLEKQDPDAEISHTEERLSAENLREKKPGTRIRQADRAGYAAQILELRRLTGTKSLEHATKEALTEAVRSSLARNPFNTILPRPWGTDLLSDLLAYFYAKPEAYDLAIGRKIRRMSCRGLAGVERVPEAT
jgi:hypothetical protein